MAGSTEEVRWNVVVAAVRCVHIAKSVTVTIIIRVVAIGTDAGRVKAIITVELRMNCRGMDQQKQKEACERTKCLHTGNGSECVAIGNDWNDFPKGVFEFINFPHNFMAAVFVQWVRLKWFWFTLNN